MLKSLCLDQVALNVSDRIPSSQSSLQDFRRAPSLIYYCTIRRIERHKGLGLLTGPQMTR